MSFYAYKSNLWKGVMNEWSFEQVQRDKIILNKLNIELMCYNKLPEEIQIVSLGYKSNYSAIEFRHLYQECALHC